jgi:hypothetical protein
MPNGEEWMRSEIASLKETVRSEILALKDIIINDRAHYKERHESFQREMGQAVLALKDQTALSFAASREAITKAEASQREYNQSHNDLSRKMESQYAMMMPRAEADREIKGLGAQIQEGKVQTETVRRELSKDIASLWSGAARGEGESRGKEKQVDTGREISQFNLSTVLSIVALAAVLLFGFYNMKERAPLPPIQIMMPSPTPAVVPGKP